MKTIMRSPAFTIALFALAVVLLGFGTVGAVQAAPRITSNDYRAQVQLTDIQTALVENGKECEGSDALLKTLLADNGDTALKIGKTYKDDLAVKNTGDIDEYVRATVRTYWTDANGKELDVDPQLIELEVGSGWTKDEAASTKERTVLYYGGVVKAGATSDPFVTGIRINSKVLTAATAGSDGETLDYEGLKFHVEATADAVQTHNGDAAMTSAWGRTN